MEAKCVEPESNQPSSVSVSLSNSVPPQCGQLRPSGTSSMASRSNQAFEPDSPKSSEMRAIVSSVQTGLPHFLQ
jgi:hypothetical protein